MEKDKSTIFSTGQTKSKAMKICSPETIGGHHVLPLGRNRVTSALVLKFITAGPQLHMPTLPCTGRTGEHWAWIPGEQLASMAEPKVFARNQHLIALV